MPQVNIYLNQRQFRDVKKEAVRNNLSPSRYGKKLFLAALEKRQKAHVIRTQIIYAFTLYSLVISALLLVF